MDPAVKLELLLCLILFHRLMKSLFSASATVGSQGNRSPSSRYQTHLSDAWLRRHCSTSIGSRNTIDNYRVRWPLLWFKKLLATAVKSVLFKFVPSSLIILPRIYIFMFKSTYVSLSAMIRNSRSLCSAEAMVLYVTSDVSTTDVVRSSGKYIELGTQRHRHGWRGQSH